MLASIRLIKEDKFGNLYKILLNFVGMRQHGAEPGIYSIRRNKNVIFDLKKILEGGISDGVRKPLANWIGLEPCVPAALRA